MATTEARKLTLMERLLGMAVLDQTTLYNGSIDQGQVAPTQVQVAKTTITCNQIENGWLVTRHTYDQHGGYRTVPTVHFYPDVVTLAEGIKNVEAVEKLTHSSVLTTANQTYPSAGSASYGP